MFFDNAVQFAESYLYLAVKVEKAVNINDHFLTSINAIDTSDNKSHLT